VRGGRLDPVYHVDFYAGDTGSAQHSGKVDAGRAASLGGQIGSQMKRNMRLACLHQSEIIDPTIRIKDGIAQNIRRD
jgi:hypothetical protein